MECVCEKRIFELRPVGGEEPIHGTGEQILSRQNGKSKDQK